MADAQTQISPAMRVSQMIISLWVPQAIHAAAELGLCDALAAEPLPAGGLARRVGTHPDATQRLLSALAVLGFVREEGERFALTELGRCLVSDGLSSRRAWARLMGGEVWRAWGRLTHCVRTGEKAYGAAEDAAAAGIDTFDAMARDPEGTAIFHQAMADFTRGEAPGIAATLDFADVRRVVDVGGGYGALLAGILKAHPRLEGDVLDLPHAEDGALRLFAAEGVSGRAGFVAGSFFKVSPPPADIYLLKSVIHDWDDQRSLEILAKCSAVMRPSDRLVLVEAPVPPDPAASPLAWVLAFSDLNMLVNTGGRERSEQDYCGLLASAGLKVTAVRDTPGGFFKLFESVPA